MALAGRTLIGASGRPLSGCRVQEGGSKNDRFHLVGGIGSFNNPNDWSPTGVPQSGDSAIVQSGTVKATNQILTGVTFQLQSTSKVTQPVLQLNNTTLQSDNFYFPASSPPPDLFATIKASGTVLSDSSINVGTTGFTHSATGNMTIHIAKQSTFVNIGSIQTWLGATLVSGGPGATFVDDGTVISGSVGSDWGPAFTIIDTRVTGTGTFQLGLFQSETKLSFGSDVARGISVVFMVENAPESLVVGKPITFLASIKGFDSVDTIELPNTAATSDTFANNHLKLFDNGTLVANLNIIGDFHTSQFVLTHTSSGGTDITVNSPPASAALPTAIAADHSLLPPLTHG